MTDLFVLSEEYLRQHPNVRESLRIMRETKPALEQYAQAVEAMRPEPVVITTSGTGTWKQEG